MRRPPGNDAARALTDSAGVEHRLPATSSSVRVHTLDARCWCRPRIAWRWGQPTLVHRGVPLVPAGGVGGGRPRGRREVAVTDRTARALRTLVQLAFIEALIVLWQAFAPARLHMGTEQVQALTVAAGFLVSFGQAWLEDKGKLPTAGTRTPERAP